MALGGADFGERDARASPLIELTTHERVAILRLARPPVNAIKLELVQTLSAAIEREAAASGPRARAHG